MTKERALEYFCRQNESNMNIKKAGSPLMSYSDDLYIILDGPPTKKEIIGFTVDAFDPQPRLIKEGEFFKDYSTGAYFSVSVGPSSEPKIPMKPIYKIG